MRYRVVFLGGFLLVFLLSLMFMTQLAFASGSEVEAISAAPQAAPIAATTSTQPIELCGQPQEMRNSHAVGWDRNGDGVMDAFDVNNDGIVDRWDARVSCPTLTSSSLPRTGAPTYLMIAVAVTLLGTAGFMLWRPPAKWRN